MAQIFSDYVRTKLPFMGGVIELDLRALDKMEAPAFRGKARDLQERSSECFVRREGESDESYGQRIRDGLEQLEAFFLEVFTATIPTKRGEQGYYLRLPGGVIENEDDDTRSIRSARELYDRATRTFKEAVLLEIGSLIEDDPLGNLPGSPSTSSSAAGPTFTDVPAPTTELSATSTSSSTATAPTSPGESSSPAE
jgi:hypothetical protein